MKNIMLDLETMGTGPTAAIIAIGAVEFDLDSGVGSREFYRVVDLESSVESGGTIDPSTVLFWMEQDDKARGEFSRKGDQLALVLQDFSKWVDEIRGTKKDINMWGNGAAFDNVILRSAYTRLSLNPPWPFYTDRCYRTVKALNPKVKFGFTGTKHHALHDAIHQALHIVEINKGGKYGF